MVGSEISSGNVETKDLVHPGNIKTKDFLVYLFIYFLVSSKGTDKITRKKEK